MHMKKKANIDTLQFLMTGFFGQITLGCLDNELLAWFGEPDDASDYNLRKACIWKYGDIEFHFDDSRRVALIFAEYFKKYPRGGSRLKVTRSSVLKGEKKLYKVECELKRLGIPFTLEVPSFDTNQTLLILQSGVKLAFINEREEYVKGIGLVNFSLMLEGKE